MNNKNDDEKLHLQELFAEVDRNQASNDKQLIDKVPQPKIDVLNLPPRKDVHGGSKQNFKLKMKGPLTRFLLVAMVLLIILISSYYYWGEDLLTILKQI